MQAEVKKQGEKSQYKGVIDAYRTIAKTEGMKGLYKGIKKLQYSSIITRYILATLFQQPFNDNHIIHF